MCSWSWSSYVPQRVAEPRPATTVACKQPGTASQGHGAPVLERGTHVGEIRGANSASRSGEGGKRE